MPNRIPSSVWWEALDRTVFSDIRILHTEMLLMLLCEVAHQGETGATAEGEAARAQLEVGDKVRGKPKASLMLM